MMKKILHLSLAAAVMLLMWSCANDALVQVPEEPCAADAAANPYRVSLKEALATADLFLDELDGGKTRKARQPRSIEYFVQDALTRSGSDADTLLYIVNYADDEGFAILGADRRVKPVYGFSNEGNLDLSDTVNNRGLALCMQNIRYSAGWLPQGPGWTVVDSTKYEPPIIHPGYPGKSDRKITYLDRIEPLIPVNVRCWAQSGQFNDFCPVVNGEMYGSKGLVGCAPLAAAQIMSYYAWPTTYAEIDLDWSIIINSEISSYTVPGTSDVLYSCPISLARFLAKVGESMDAQYLLINGEMTTNVMTYQLRDSFSKFGYKYVGNPKDFSDSQPWNDLESGPLLVSGWTSRTSGDVGHTWVIDGYLSYKEEWDAIANDSHTLYYSFYHCVWGWGGANNGYFIIDNAGLTTTPYVNDIVDADNDKRINGSYTFGYLTYFAGFTPLR